MEKHIGIVACSSEGASLCYRTICLEGVKYLGKYGHPEITMHTFSLSEYMLYIESKNWEQVGRLMLLSAEKLQMAGADFLISPDNTIHQALDLLIHKSPLPWLHIAEVVAHEAKKQNFKKIGILGTQYLMEGPVYPAKLKAKDIELQIPEKSDREKIDKIIFDELICGIFTDPTHKYFSTVIDKLKATGCDAIVLGCTEIPLIVTADSSSLPILDSTRLLAKAALLEAVN